MKKFGLIHIIIIALVARVAFLLLFIDYEDDHYWEYGYIAYNILDGNGLSVNYNPDNQYRSYYQIGERAYPTALMPIGYIIYILPFLSIDNHPIRNIALFGSQILLSIIVLFFVYKLTKLLFNKQIALIAALAYAIMPEMILTVLINAPVVQFHLIFVIFLYYFVKYSNSNTNLQLILLGAILAICLYFRSDIALFIIFFFIYLFIHKKYKSIIIISITILIALSPWMIRNYNVFDKFIPLTTNTGFNIYRAHHKPDNFTMVVNSSVMREFDKFRDDENFEIIQNEIYTRYGLNYIKNNLSQEIIKGFENIIALITIQYKEDNSTNILYIVPWFILLIISFFTLFKLRKQKTVLVIFIYILANIILSFFFFSITRYQTMMKIVLFPYFAYGVNELIKHFKLKYISKNQLTE